MNFQIIMEDNLKIDKKMEEKSFDYDLDYMVILYNHYYKYLDMNNFVRIFSLLLSKKLDSNEIP